RDEGRGAREDKEIRCPLHVFPRPSPLAPRPCPGAGMTKLLDRMLVYNYIKAYLICLVSLLGLYIVVDLFTNIDDFTQQHSTLGGFVRHVAKYYGVQVTVIFDRLCAMIVLLADMFTVAWVQRNNAMVLLMSVGVSTASVL